MKYFLETLGEPLHCSPPTISRLPFLGHPEQQEADEFILRCSLEIISQNWNQFTLTLLFATRSFCYPESNDEPLDYDETIHPRLVGLRYHW